MRTVVPQGTAARCPRAFDRFVGFLGGSGLSSKGAMSLGVMGHQGWRVHFRRTTGNGFDVESLLVLTDGMENTAPFIADVAADINELTYSVGLGTPENISVAALQAISGNHGGYLLITGPISGDNRFLLQKYFLQILAGITNAEIVLDPQGYLVPGKSQIIPFPVTDADAGLDVILLTPYPESVNFRLRTPTSSSIIDPSTPASHPYVQFVRSRGVSYYRLSLPAELSPGRLDQGGVWQVLLDIGKERETGRAVSTRPNRNQTFAQYQVSAALRGQSGLPFSLLIHAYSNLSFRAAVSQSGYEPGARVQLTATLAESGVPEENPAFVWAEIAAPGNQSFQITLSRTEQGAYSGHFVADQVGVYRARVRAAGTTLRGFPYRREQTVTAAVWVGGNSQGRPGSGPGDRLCDFLKCVFGEKGVVSIQAEELLRKLGFDLTSLRNARNAAFH